MKSKILPLTRFLGFGLTTLALAACGAETVDTVTAGGQTDSATSGEETSETASTTPTTGQTTQTTKTTDEPTGGSNTISGGESSTGDATTDAETTNVTDGTTTDSGATDSGTTEMVTPECGNGMVEGTEQCDNGPDVPDDDCGPGCQFAAVCGNGMVEVGESCDDGNTADGDDCSADCQTITTPVVCGDGKQEGDEQCDNGPDVPDDGCEADCTVTPPECGNGKVEGDEACDDGNEVNGGADDFCKNDCSVFTPPQCQAPADYTICDTNINLADKADKTNAHKAMGICNAEASNSVQITDFDFQSANNAAWQVAKGFGTHLYDHDMMPGTPDKLYYSPREGDAFLMISTGVIKAPNNAGVVIENNASQGGNGNNNNSDTNPLPPPFQSKVGSANGAGGTPFLNCDGVNDCSDTLQQQWIDGNNDPNDKLWFTFKTKVPLGTFGYTFDFVFCSSEWPVWVDTGFNDLLIAYQVDPSADDPNADPPIDPYTGNVTFIPDPNDATKGLPLTITALDPYFVGPGFTDNEAPLKGTGFEGHACTEWFTAKGGVQPGAEITIGFFIADMSDSILATMAILDNFRWDCEGCIPSEVDDCGVQDPQ